MKRKCGAVPLKFIELSVAIQVNSPKSSLLSDALSPAVCCKAIKHKHGTVHKRTGKKSFALYKTVFIFFSQNSRPKKIKLLFS